MAALMASLIDIGWLLLRLDCWVGPDGFELDIGYEDPLGVARAWVVIEQVLESRQWGCVASSTCFCRSCQRC